MKEIDRIVDEWGQFVIRVWECDKFINDKNIPKNPNFGLHNQESEKIHDIIYAVEDYFNDSGQ